MTEEERVPRRRLDRAVTTEGLRLDRPTAHRVRDVLVDLRTGVLDGDEESGLLAGREPLLALNGACNVLTELECGGRHAAIEAIAAGVDPLALSDGASGTMRQHRRRWLVPIALVLADAARVADAPWLELCLLGLVSGRVLGSAVSWYRAGTPARADVLCDAAVQLPERLAETAVRSAPAGSVLDAPVLATIAVESLATSVEAVDAGVRRLDLLRTMATPPRVRGLEALALSHASR